MDVLNGGNTTGLAGRISAALTRAGYLSGRVGNAAARTATAVRYGSGASASAAAIARVFAVTAAASRAVPPGHVEILLGASTVMPAIRAIGTRRASAAVIPTAGTEGGVVRARNGIPCVN